jgi:hypothetical protein
MENARYIPPRRWRDRIPRRSFVGRWLAFATLVIVAALIVLVLIYRHA